MNSGYLTSNKNINLIIGNSSIEKIDINKQRRGIKILKDIITHISVWSNARYSSIIPSEKITQSSSLSIEHKPRDLAVEDGLLV